MKTSLKTTFASLLVIGLISCGGKTESGSTSSAKANPSVKEASSGGEGSGGAAASSNRKGKLIYKQYCVICHGSDGKLGVSDATDLSTSTASLEDRIDQITNGKGLMTPYKDILSEEQIKSVAEYVEELHQ